MSNDNNRIVNDLGKRLLEAARLGNSDEVSNLMKNGAPLTTDWLGTTPLHLAAIYGHTETAEILIKSGISRDGRTKVRLIKSLCILLVSMVTSKLSNC